MRSFRTPGILLASVLALAGLSWLGYALFNRFQPPSRSPFDAIPGNTALVIQLNRAGSLLDELNRSNLLWRTFSRFPGISTIRNELHYVDSASRRNENINAIFRKHELLVAITLSGKRNFGAIYLARIPGRNPESYILDFISEINARHPIHSETPYSTTTLHRIQSGSGRDAFYFAVLKGVFIGSFHADLVKRSIDRLSLNTPMAASAGFRKVQASAGKKADANVYVNYRFFSLVLSRILREEALPDLLKLSNFAEWSGLDLIIKKDELLFNGITVASDSTQQFLSLFADQQPQPLGIVAVIPEKAIQFTSYGWSDPSRFCQRFQNRMQRDENYTEGQNDILSIIDRYQLNISEYYLPWMGHEGGVFVMKRPDQPDNTNYAVFATTDTVRAATSLFALADTLGLRFDSSLYRRHKIYRVTLPPFLPALFGEIFGKCEAGCFTFLGPYIVFAPRPADLEPVIESTMERATLDHDRVFTEFVASMPDKSNILTYFNTRNAVPSLKQEMNQDLALQLAPVMDSLRKFESVAFQYTNSDGQFYSSIFLRYDPRAGGEGPLQWELALDTTLASRPAVIPVDTRGDHAVITTDVANNLYIVSSQGHIIHKMPVMGKLLGTFHTIQLPGHDSLFIVFNTDTHLYMLHGDGRYADKFPMRFPLHATGGLTIVDWENDGNYRVLVPFQDNRLYCFTLDGISCPGWNRPGPGEEIADPPVCLPGPDRGHRAIFISGISGNSVITDEDGNALTSPGRKITHAPNSAVYPNRTGRKEPFLSTGNDGKVMFINRDGKTSDVTFNFFTPFHRFFYADISGNDQPEFIFSDKNMIYYYNKGSKLVYSYAFRREMSQPPFLLKGIGGKAMVGFVVPETREIFLFGDHGLYELESGIRGTTPFDIGPLENGTRLNLVTGDGKLLRNFRLTQP